jgi:hypothetical protein
MPHNEFQWKPAYQTGQIRDLRPSEDNDEIEIMHSIGYLCGDIPNSANMRYNLVKLLQTIDVSNGLNWEFCKGFLKNVIIRWHISIDLKAEINCAIKDYGKEQKQFIDSLLMAKLSY